MHALITNLALNYSPDEIDLYLIDFKKGVEFKVYATHELPHASVVAIESEREFGLSVLQRLDAELRLRADRFRDAGVQDINGYRNVPGTPPLPRILLIVDEFQEFFVEEDKLAQEAALWLDRLVRQGRAFGIHVLLGSQSLGGAFTPGPQHPRPDGRADRPAVQRDRRAPDPEREQHRAADALAPRRGDLQRRQRRARGQPLLPGRLALRRAPRGVPEAAPRAGPASGSRSWRGPRSSSRGTPRPTWRATRCCGSGWTPRPGPSRRARPRPGSATPIAIKDPTSALFRRQGGNHLLIVGQNEEAALGVDGLDCC